MMTNAFRSRRDRSSISRTNRERPTSPMTLDGSRSPRLSRRTLRMLALGLPGWLALSVWPQAIGSPLEPTRDRRAIAQQQTAPMLDPRTLLSPPIQPATPARPTLDRANAPLRVLDIQETAEGFFIRTNRRPQVSTRLLSSPARLAIDLIDTDVAGLYGAKKHAINRHGVYALRFSQWQPDVARIVLDVAPFNTRWSIDYDADRGGLRVSPQGRTAFNPSAPGRSLASRPSSARCDRVPLPAAIARVPNEDPTQLAYPLAVAAPLSSGFGYRTHPVTGANSFHEGIDLAAPTGTPILAALSGEVTFAGGRGNLGNAVILDHARNYRTRYGHMSRAVVRTGDRVRQGQLIGYVGSTGRSTGPHLHFEYLQQTPDGAWIALDPQAQVLAATPSGASSPLAGTTNLAIGGDEFCDRP